MPEENVTTEIMDNPPGDDNPPSPEGNPPDNQNVIDENKDSFKYPGFYPDDLKLPTEFKDTNEEGGFYKETYLKNINFLNSDEFREQLLENYKDNILEQEYDVDKLKAIKDAMDGNPEQMLKIYFPDAAAGIGHTQFMSNDDKFAYIDSKLQEEFGKNYREEFDANDVVNSNSKSAQIWKKQTELMTDLSKREQEFAEKNKPITQEDIDKKLKDEYETKFKNEGFTVKEYQDFIKETQNYNYTTEDLHHMVYFKDYVDTAYEEGFKDGQKKITNGIKRATMHDILPQVQKPKETISGDVNEYRMNLYRTKKV